MRSIKRSFASLALIAAVLFSAAPFTLAVDEGMFTPDQIAKLPLAKRGLKIKPIDIYSPSGGGLTDAVIRVNIGTAGGFGTGEFVASEGLILTNHHVGFDALVAASTPDRDLVETGFKTDGRAGEIPAKDYSSPLKYRILVTGIGILEFF